MDSETEEIKQKWIWIFESISTASRGLAKWNRAIHQKLHTKYPKSTRFVGSSLRLFFEISTHPSFAVLVAFLLVGLAISEAITIIVSVSAFSAWLVTILWVAHSRPLEQVSILPKIVIVIAIAFGSAYVANRYAKWCLARYALKHSSESPKLLSSTEQKPSDNQLLLEAFNKALARSVPVRKTPPSEPSKSDISSTPSFGNLADRANALSDEIMQDLNTHGWRSNSDARPSGAVVEQMPTKLADIQKWTQDRSNFFRFRFFDRVVDLRNEFAQIHVRDERLDEFLKMQGAIEQEDKQMAARGLQVQMQILPQQIEDVAKRLKVLVSQIPLDRDPPKALPFSVTQVRPERSELPFEIVTTIETDHDLVRGYIAVEFDGKRAMTSTDFIGSHLTIANHEDEVIGNKQLRDYLLVHREDSYVIEIGNVPFTSTRPVRIFASATEPFRVSRVIFFEK